MTQKEFNKALAELGITNRTHAAATLGIGRKSVIRYAQGEQVVPGALERLIEMFRKHGIPEEYKSWNAR